MPIWQISLTISGQNHGKDTTRTCWSLKNSTYIWGEDLSGSLQGVGGLLLVADSTNTYAPVYDANGNVNAYVDANTGAQVADFSYSPFGRTINKSGSKVDEFDYKFSTKPEDQETGLYYYIYRFYDPELGRWLSRDKIEEDGGLNIYGFINNDGIDTWDYLGQEWRVERDDGPWPREGKRYAIACRSKGDKLKNLAKQIGLDVDDAFGSNGWLKDYYWDPVTSLGNETFFRIPNVVYIGYGPAHLLDLNPLGLFTSLFWKNYERARQEAIKYWKQGFKLVTTTDVTEAQAISHLTSDDIYVYIFSGHGYDGQLSTKGGSLLPGRYTPYKIHHMTLYACSSLKTNYKVLTQAVKNPAGKSIWNANVAKSGWVEGYIEDTSLLTDSIYRKKYYGTAILTAAGIAAFNFR